MTPPPSADRILVVPPRVPTVPSCPPSPRGSVDDATQLRDDDRFVGGSGGVFEHVSFEALEALTDGSAVEVGV